MFTGWPDFTMIQHYSRVERRLGKDIFKTGRVRGVGEIQSPPGASFQTKMATVAQAGIYMIGQFSKLRQIAKRRKLASIILFKDITAQVALATINPSLANQENSIGGVTYKIVDSLHGYNLNDPIELSQFASVFITTLKNTLQGILHKHFYNEYHQRFGFLTTCSAQCISSRAFSKFSK